MKAVLVWVDAFERFYQMPEKAFEEFQETGSYNKLAELGYSIYDETSNFTFKPKHINELNILINHLP
jgi:hypothetical protein